MRFEWVELNRLQTMTSVRAEMKIIDMKMFIMKENMLAPAIVMPYGDDLIVVNGKKMFYAAQSLGWDKLPCVILDKPLNSERDYHYYELLLNRGEKFHIDEIVAIFEEILDRTDITMSEKEYLLGIESGEFDKLDEVIQFARTCPQYQDKVFSKLLKGKTTIATAHKNIDKYAGETGQEEVTDFKGADTSVTVSQEPYKNCKEEPVPLDVMMELKAIHENTCYVCGRQEKELADVYEALKKIPDYINTDINHNDLKNLVLCCPTCKKAIRLHSLGRLTVNEAEVYPRLLELSGTIKQAIEDTGRPVSIFVSIEQMRGLFN